MSTCNEILFVQTNVDDPGLKSSLPVVFVPHKQPAVGLFFFWEEHQY